MLLEHFIYSAYPNQGYGITACTPNLDKHQWIAFREPLPVDSKSLEKLGKVWALQTYREHIVLSLFTDDARDEFNRIGIYSHNIIIPLKDYLALKAPVAGLARYLMVDTQRSGELPHLDVRTEDLQVEPGGDTIAGATLSSLMRILERILANDSTTIVCADRDSGQMLSLASTVIQMLPPSQRAVSFITAPLSREYGKQRSESDFKLKLVQERSLTLSGARDYVDIAHDYTDTGTGTSERKIARSFIEEFNRRGKEGIKALHSLWERGETSVGDPRSRTRDFARDLEVIEGAVSVGAVSQMRQRGKKQEAKYYAQAILREHKWKDPEELIEIFTMLLQDSPAEAEAHVAQLIRETANIEPAKRLLIYDKIAASFGKEMVTGLKSHSGPTFFTQVKDLSRYPALLSNLLDTQSVETLVATSREILDSSVGDDSAFKNNVQSVMSLARGSLGDAFLDFVQQLAGAFPEYKATLLDELKVEDVVPADILSRLPQNLRQRLIANMDRLIRILKTASSD
ncbi:MAG: hypothetical protein V1894_00785 [Chloroflexota bacterium]